MFGSLKLSKIHPFCIVLYFFGLKGLDDEKGISELLTYLFRLYKNEKDRVIFVVKLVKKINSDKLVFRRERVSLSLGSLKHSDGFARRENYRTSICYPPQA